MTSTSPVTDRSGSRPRTAIAYARVSLAREETISPQIQMEAIRAWATRQGRTLVGEPIIEEGKSGRDFNRRIMEAIERIEAGEADEILVWKYSRFGRNTYENALNCKRIESAGGNLVSVTEEVDASTATGGFTRDMLFALANMESKRIGEGWKEAQAVRIKAGLPHSGGPRFGYQHHKCGSQAVTSAGWRIRHEKDPLCRSDGTCREEYRVDPVTGPVLADLYKRYVGGDAGSEGLADLAAWCNETGQPRDRGGLWYPSSVADLLDSGFGAGLLRVGVKGTKGRPDKDEAIEYLPGAHDPVIKPDMWDRYLAKRRGLSGTPSSLKRSRWPLTGLIKCGLCGGMMTCASSSRGRGYIYRCSRMQNLKTCPGTWRTRAAIEKALFNQLDIIADELTAAARNAARTVKRPTADTQTARSKAEQELDDISAAKKRLVRQVALGNLTDEDIDGEMAALRKREAAAKKSLNRTAVAPRPWSPPEIRSLREDWPRLPVTAAREIAQCLVEEIIVHREKRIEVRLSTALVAGGGEQWVGWVGDEASRTRCVRSEPES